MKNYEVRKRISYTDVAQINISKDCFERMSDNDVLRVVNRMLVLNNAKVRINTLEYRDTSYNMATTDSEVIVFLYDEDNIKIQYATYIYNFALVQII